MSKNNSNNIFGNNSNLFQDNISEQERLKDLEESSLKFNEMKRKAALNNAKKQQNLNSQSDDEDEDEDEYDEDEDIDGYEESEEEGKTSFLLNLLKKVGGKTLLSSGATLGSVAAISMLLISMYRVHFDGEFEFKGIGGEYQSSSFKLMNFLSFDEEGGVQLNGLTKENKLTKAFYTLYSDNSYYVIVEDSSKYKNVDDAYKRENLLTPDELREKYPDIKDAEGREQMFEINPDVLYSLDTYLHKGKYLYPQQFIKPVYYKESKDEFELNMLTDDSGNVVAKSQAFDGEGKIISGSKVEGVWDYGVASVLRYKEYEVKERDIVNIVGTDLTYNGYTSPDGNNSSSSSVSQTINKVPSTHVYSNESGTSSERTREKPAYAIDKAVTSGGTITSNVVQKWQEKSGSRSTYTKTHTIKETETYTVTVDKPIRNETGQIVRVEKVKETRERVHSYTFKYTYEKYTEEYVPTYEGNLDTSEIVGSQYYRQYIQNYSTYIPQGVPGELDYSILEDENEDVNALFYDDTPGQFYNGGQNTENQENGVEGETFNAEFTAYIPTGNPTANGDKTDPSKNTCAAPIQRDYPKSLLKFGSKIKIGGTGTNKDGIVCTVNDTGGAIKLVEQSDGTLKYKIDILVANNTEARAFGRRQGTITIMNDGTTVASVSTASFSSDNLRTLIRTVSNARTSSLMLNTGGNAVTNYGMSMDDYAKKRVPSGSCDSSNCTVAKYRENVEPDAYKNEVGDLRHLRLDVYRPVDETAFNKRFAEQFHSTMAPYGQALIDACKEKNIDVLAKMAQYALESGWGKSAIVGQLNGVTYYNFSGIGANDGNAYNGGLAYAKKKGWDSPKKAMIGAVEFLADDYIHNETYKQNTLFKISMPWKSPNEHWYASDPDYAYKLAKIMSGWTDLYSSGASFYYDIPTFDPTKEVGTIEGVGHGVQLGGNNGSGGAVSAFNSQLISNWDSFIELKDDLFPWVSELDENLEKESKGNYEKGYATRSPYKHQPIFSETDEAIILNMMFALNQGNYLSKYDGIGEAEWKAMYNQLLSSPTGKTWDDKWIGFNCEDVFGMPLEELGDLFDSSSGANPVVSKPFGKLKNVYSDDLSELSQYDEMNFGLDITIAPDNKVLSIADGEVIGVDKNARNLSRYGNYVKIQYNPNTTLIIANLKEVDSSIKVGKKITKQQVIGVTGGDCKSYKEGELHIALIYKGDYINPEWILTKDMTGFEDPIEGNNGGGVICNNSSSSNVSGVSPDYVETAKQQTDKPYVYGTAGPNSFDCSGLVYWSMKQHGIDIPRDSRSQRKATTRIKYEELQPGDLIFRHGAYGNESADTSNDNIVEHVMIYIGNNQVVHASSPSRGILIEEFKVKKNHTFGRYDAANNGSVSSGSSSSASSDVCVAPGNVDNGSYLWPVPGYSEVSSPYGWRIHPVLGTRKFHTGIDVPAPKGTPIVATKSGTVVYSDVKGTYGNCVDIDHGNGIVSRYTHNSKNLVKVGDVVNQGQTIAEVGTTGRSTGNHLHFEIRVNDEDKDPLNYVSP